MLVQTFRLAINFTTTLVLLLFVSLNCPGSLVELVHINRFRRQNGGGSLANSDSLKAQWKKCDQNANKVFLKVVAEKLKMDCCVQLTACECRISLCKETIFRATPDCDNYSCKMGPLCLAESKPVNNEECANLQNSQNALLILVIVVGTMLVLILVLVIGYFVMRNMRCSMCLSTSHDESNTHNLLNTASSQNRSKSKRKHSRSSGKNLLVGASGGSLHKRKSSRGSASNRVNQKSRSSIPKVIPSEQSYIINQHRAKNKKSLQQQATMNNSQRGTPGTLDNQLTLKSTSSFPNFKEMKISISALQRATKL